MSLYKLYLVRHGKTTQLNVGWTVVNFSLSRNDMILAQTCTKMRLAVGLRAYPPVSVQRSSTPLTGFQGGEPTSNGKGRDKNKWGRGGEEGKKG